MGDVRGKGLRRREVVRPHGAVIIGAGKLPAGIGSVVDAIPIGSTIHGEPHFDRMGAVVAEHTEGSPIGRDASYLVSIVLQGIPEASSGTGCGVTRDRVVRIGNPVAGHGGKAVDIGRDI